MFLTVKVIIPVVAASSLLCTPEFLSTVVSLTATIEALKLLSPLPVALAFQVIVLAVALVLTTIRVQEVSAAKLRKTTVRFALKLAVQ